MNFALPQTRMTADEYLTWAQDKPGRYELVDGCVVAMAPDRPRHNLGKLDAVLALRDAVTTAGLPCTVFADGMIVRISEHSSRVPDASIQWDVETNLDAVILETPLVVVEIASPASERKDGDDLLLEYFSVASVRHYLIILPERRVVIHHRRNERGTIDTRIAYESETLLLAPPGMSVAVAALLGQAEPTLDPEH